MAARKAGLRTKNGGRGTEGTAADAATTHLPTHSPSRLNWGSILRARSASARNSPARAPSPSLADAAATSAPPTTRYTC